jgi:16S rRNA (guanine527-N7)-methyltransferase
MAVDARVQQYAGLLLEWNRRINLTGARSMAELEGHLADAQRLLSLDWSGVESVVDIGSGGGLPAIPLAIQLPHIWFTLVEADRRKAAFLLHVGGTLALQNVAVSAVRAEVLGHDPAFRERFDRATARAAAPPAVLLELALPFLRVGGLLIDQVGEVDPQALVAASRRLGGGTPSLHRVTGGLMLVVAKETPTPAVYPRRPGIPTRRPLG